MVVVEIAIVVEKVTVTKEEEEACVMHSRKVIVIADLVVVSLIKNTVGTGITNYL